MAKPTTIPVVMIHGVGLDHTMWLPVMAALSQRRTIAYDMIGHGAARKPAGPYTLGTFVDQLGAIVEAVDCEIDLVGFSMGALVAQGLALSPIAGRIRTMVLLNAVHDRSAADRQAIIARVAEVRAGQFAATVEPALQRWFTPAFAATHPESVAAVGQRLLANDERSYAHAYEVFATADAGLASRVPEITVPTLVATGSDDQRSTPAMAAALAAALPRGRATVLPGLRHLTPLESPELVADLIDEFTST
jgi:pimeloyl-ACP methyl ester carboxylesterase